MVGYLVGIMCEIVYCQLISYTIEEWAVLREVIICVVCQL